MSLPLVLRLDADGLALEVAGGKAANLGILVRAGFPVPAAFVVTTHAYDDFVAIHGIQPWAALAAGETAGDGARLEAVSAAIRARFAAAAMPAEISHGILAAYAALGAPAVAVRSSATTEDLPDLSFAGQQESFLSVAGGAAVLAAVVRCWSSLWTARAIAYRNRSGVPHDAAKLAVVVQVMVESEASGVLFTANPLTGRRSELVIEATLGLGEALVSGLVEPDRYSVDPANRQVLSKTLGGKALVIRGSAEGGTTTSRRGATVQQALPDSAILDLAALGADAARHFGAPQDIEWAWASNRLYLLQSRPVTSLYPLPEGLTAPPLQVLISIGAIQGMLDPFTPFGRDLFRSGAQRLASLVAPSLPRQSQQLLWVAGGRLFANVTGLLRNAHTRPVVRRALGMVEPGIARAMEVVLADARLQPGSDRMPLGFVARAFPLIVRVLANASFCLLWPDAGRARIQRAIARSIAAFEAECAAASTLSERLALCDALFSAVTRFGPVLMPGLGVGLGSLHALHRLAAGVAGGADLVLDVTRGLPHNVTTEMDLALWETAVAIRRVPEAAAHVAQTDVEVLAEEWRAAALAPEAQTAIAGFLRRFGMRGVAEIDVGRERWREDPRLLFQALKSYLQITDLERAPDMVFRRGAASAESTIEALAAGVRKARKGWIQERAVRWAARRVRSLAGLRESPKFTVIRLLGLLRATLLSSGVELVRAGVLEKADDLFFLELEEVGALARDEGRDWRKLVDARRATFERERGRRQVPLLLLSDGVAHYATVDASQVAAGERLEGTPVSAGVVEGRVRVVRDPHGTRLEPGEILVCPGTDPAWTPLFLTAGGLVTEVGGLMTHGSVVAREYGIPAVVGVPGATVRLATGTRVRVDGGRGIVTILDE